MPMSADPIFSEILKIEFFHGIGIGLAAWLVVYSINRGWLFFKSVALS